MNSRGRTAAKGRFIHVRGPEEQEGWLNRILLRGPVSVLTVPARPGRRATPGWALQRLILGSEFLFTPFSQSRSLTPLTELPT